MTQLAACQGADRALSREFYTDPAIFALDMARMLESHWFCAGHVSQLPLPGDYILAELGAESVIILRQADGGLRAVLNVCRHRGSRLLAERAGHVAGGRIVCPYHAWTYNEAGGLLAARHMKADFAARDWGLKQVSVRVVEGLILLCFAATPPDLAPAAASLGPVLRTHGWARARVAHSKIYTVAANWKLLVENYMECYHCTPAHREFSRRHLYASPAALVQDAEQTARARAEQAGIFITDIERYGNNAGPGCESFGVMRSALQAGWDSASETGRGVAPLMGSFAAYDGGSTYMDIGPIANFLAYADHGVIYRFVPKSVDLTEMEIFWLVDEAAVEGRDYDLAALIWLWHHTSLEDKRIVEMNQAGVNSRYYEPGPYAQQEEFAGRFVAWYLAALGG